MNSTIEIQLNIGDIYPKLLQWKKPQNNYIL